MSYINYKKNVENSYKGRTISELCNFYILDNSTLTEDDRKKIIEAGYVAFSDDTFEVIPEWLYYELSYTGEPNDIYFDIEEFNFIMDNIIKKSSYGYLVMNTCYDWLHRRGYQIADTIKEAFERSYDVTQEIIAATVGGKVLKIRESSHDVPTGAATYVIALNMKERALVENGNFGFVRKCIDNVNKKEEKVA